MPPRPRRPGAVGTPAKSPEPCMSHVLTASRALLIVISSIVVITVLTPIVVLRIASTTPVALLQLSRGAVVNKH